MCGITGIFNFNKEPVPKELINSMCDSIRHRGPDDKGILIDKNIGLGMRRLSIIDLETGKQPIHNEKEDKYIFFNGEIYNYQELRQELQEKGHRFYTKSDTEVIVHLYEQYGIECLQKLNGMFSFAIWDTNKNELFIARDRLGIKPLYYYFDEDQFVFGSEIKPILKCIKGSVNYDAIPYFLGYEYVPTPFTIFKDIFKLPAGHYLICRKKKIEVKRYWDLGFLSRKNDTKTCIKTIRKLLSDSVEKRMIADVPLGAFLSGGIDSSAIVAFMKERSDNVKTFSIGFKDKSYNELDHARGVAELFNTDHTEKVLDPDIIKLTERMTEYFDEPFADISAIPTFLVSELAAKKVKVVLSGDGGDEVFAGYERYVASKVSRYYRLPIQFNRFFADHLRPRSKKKGLINMFQRLNEGLLLPDEARHMRWQFFLNDKIIKGLYGNNKYSLVELLRPINNYYSNAQAQDSLEREQYTDIKLYLADDILVKLDRMTMANSIEARVPFLDHRLVEFSATIPSNLKLSGLTTKNIFKKSMQGVLPSNIIKRKKEGFSIPVKNWLRNELKSYMEEIVKDRFIRQTFNKNYIDKIIKLHSDNKRNFSHQLWALMMLGLWHRRYIDEAK